MSHKEKAHDLVAHLKKLASELGRVPTRVQFCDSFVGGDYKLRHLFGNYGTLISAAGLTPNSEKMDQDPRLELKLRKQFEKICSKKTLVESFFTHTLNLEELFQRAGNPEILKLNLMPDLHVKHRDRVSFNAYLKFLEYYAPDIHLNIGDFLDCDGASHWPSQVLQPRRLVPEAKDGRLIYDEIRRRTPNCSTYLYCEGNHENWIKQALLQMPEFFDGLEELGMDITLEKLLDLQKHNIQLFPVNDLVQIGKANFTHGWYAGRTHTKTHMDTLKANIFYGHTHDAQELTVPSINGNLTAASHGTFERKDAPFLKGKPNNWVHGSGCFEFFRDGSFIRNYVTVSNGKIVYNGKLFDGNIIEEGSYY